MERDVPEETQSFHAIPGQTCPGQPRLQAIVTGISPANTVEFTFVYGDPDLSVELVLPLPAFREFCSENGCLVAVPDDLLRMSVRRLISPIPVAPFIPLGETELNS